MQARRYSFQREKIYEAVRNSSQHPTAEMIYAQLKPELPVLSLGTVYRNLHQMAAEGRLRQLSGTVVRFDGIVAPHTHFCCDICGAVTDLEHLPYEAALDLAAEKNGFQVRGHALSFYGVCPACSEKSRNHSDQSIERST